MGHTHDRTSSFPIPSGRRLPEERHLPHFYSRRPPNTPPPNTIGIGSGAGQAGGMAAAAAAKIAPSMLSSDFANLAAEADRMVRLGADWLHMDIMVTCAIPLSPRPPPSDPRESSGSSSIRFPPQIFWPCVPFGL